jgi:3-phenylpropionate/cinnamic acid dioxygenase small subunit
MEELEARIKGLEDIEAIKKLKARYCYSVDARDFNELLSLFTEDATADFGSRGKYVGKTEITRFFTEVFPSDRAFTIHYVHGPVIEVNGEKARGRWYFEVLSTRTQTNEVVMTAGRYDEEYSKREGEWKFSSLVAKFYYRIPFDQG